MALIFSSRRVFSSVLILFTTSLFFASSQRNPTILQDSRDLPTPEGHFGFLYRTEDGIAHGARGDSNGVVHGRFTYTDPTGLKVNFNYNAGSRATPGYRYNDVPEDEPAPARNYQQQPTAPAVRPIEVAARASSRASARAPVESSRDLPASPRAEEAPIDDYYDQPRSGSSRVEYYDQYRYNDAGY